MGKRLAGKEGLIRKSGGEPQLKGSSLIVARVIQKSTEKEGEVNVPRREKWQNRDRVRAQKVSIDEHFVAEEVQ